MTDKKIIGVSKREMRKCKEKRMQKQEMQKRKGKGKSLKIGIK